MSSTTVELGQNLAPAGEAMHWHPVLVGVHAVADVVLTAAYLGLGCTFMYVLRHGARLRLPVAAALTLLAALFIAAAATQATQAVTLWHPEYAVSGIAKLATAVLSVGAITALIRAVPGFTAGAALIEPANPASAEAEWKARVSELTATNEKLRREVAERDDSEAEVRRLNAALQLHVAELQSLFKTLPVGVAIATDATCRTIRSNEAFAEMMGLGAARSTTLSSPPFAMPALNKVTHDGRDLPEADQPMQRAIAQNTPVRDFEQTVTRADGSTLDLLVNAVPVRNAAGEAAGCVATFQDFSARRQAERKRLDFERRLLHSQKLESIGVLAGGIAHDFNNLLTGVLGHANFARGELARGSTNIDHLLAQVETSAQRAADLCRQLLAYAGKGRIVVRLIDLNVAVQQTVPLLKLSVSKKVNLDLQLAASLPPLRGDPSQINQVLLNLVTNASEAIGNAAGTVTIRTERVNVTPMDMLTLTASPEMEPGAFICLEVRDTGCGISPETIGHIFEPFFTTKFVGRGLGLAAVIGIVHGHHGGIRVSSQVGVGTTFEVFLPAMTPAARGSSPPFAAPAHRGTVLVVDDDITVREFAAAVLTGAGFNVATAVDGEDALARLRREPMQFDVVLLDLSMPKLDGEDTLVAMRMISPNLPVVLTSGYSEHAVVQRFVSRGLADFLPKPFVSEALLDMITNAIERTRTMT